MPEPLERRHRYIRGLDGLRALAVLAVVGFHLGLSWVPGGLIGVGIFFTLSGYLITDLLLGHWKTQGDLELKQFWLRRARRLLPALAVLLAGVGIWVALAQPGHLGQLWGDVGAAAGYFSNWWLIFHHISYFARFGPPSPLGHLWSLAIEEQFYLIWPWLLWAGIKFVKRPKVLAVVTLAAAALSATEMALLWHPGSAATRVYDGTDTRAFGLLIGAAVAFVWPANADRRLFSRWNARRLDLFGAVGLAGLLVMALTVGEYSSFLFLGGLGLVSVATALVIIAVVHPASRLGRLLGVRPLRWLGVRSYGIYLWHYPIIVLTTPILGHGPTLARSFAQVVATMTVAALSWRYIEDPIRSGRWRNFNLSALRPGRPYFGPNRTPAYLAGIAAAIALVSLTVLSPADSPGRVTPGRIAAASVETLPTTTPTAPPTTVALVGPTTVAPLSGHGSSREASTTATVPASTSSTVHSTTTVGPSESAAASSPTTSCRSVVHIGDSTSESLMSADYLPNPAQRLDAQYRRVGVVSSNMQISGARSIIETYDGQPSGYQVAQSIAAAGYHGCWVVALGTNDTADIAAGSILSENTRITKIMSAFGNQPVMWVDVVSLLNSGEYSAANMAKWDKTLIQACSKYPNMRVYDWASQAQAAWFTNDGIHYSTPGSAARAELIADALAKAFPAKAIPPAA